MNTPHTPPKFDLSELSTEQKYAFQKCMNGDNLFITGPGGTGKSKLIQYLDYYSNANDKKCQVCSLTGCSTILLNCNARTIHSWSGIKLARGPKHEIIRDIIKNKKLSNTWKHTDLLIIDEVSMLSLKIFELLEEIGRTIRKNSRPFGGIQVIFTGDFFQLPPVPSAGEPDTEKFCFESPLWQILFPPENHIELLTIFRQTDPVYIDILMEIRRGSISEDNIQLLQTYVKREYKPEENGGCVPTKLFAIRNKADFINKLMFEKIEKKSHDFNINIKTDCTVYLDSCRPFPPEVMIKCRDLTLTEKEREVEYLLKALPCSDHLQLKIGSCVMCCFNMDVENGICNGSQGIITDILERIGTNIPIVKFSNGIVMPIEKHYWQSSEYPCVAVGQIPLCLAWALTIHKIQGSTMSMAEIDIGLTIFEYGQVYVALSRIRSLQGLYLLNFNPNKIKANPKVVDFYDNIPKNKIIMTDLALLDEKYNFSKYNYHTDNPNNKNNLNIKSNTDIIHKELKEEIYNDHSDGNDTISNDPILDNKTFRFIPSKKIIVKKI